MLNSDHHSSCSTLNVGISDLHACRSIRTLGSKPPCGVAAAGLQRYRTWSPPQDDASQPEADPCLATSLAGQHMQVGRFPVIRRIEGQCLPWYWSTM